MNRLFRKYRYFLVSFSYSSGEIYGSGNLWFRATSFPSNIWLKDEASKGKDYTSDKVVVSTIYEFKTKMDFNSFISVNKCE